MIQKSPLTKYKKPPAQILQVQKQKLIKNDHSQGKFTYISS